MWKSVEKNHLSEEEFQSQQEQGLAEYQDEWKRGLLLEGQQDLRESLLYELASYLGEDLAEIERRCAQGSQSLEHEWHETVNPTDRQSIEEFYDKSRTVLYELVWWHTLCDDNSPLAYVTALDFAKQNGCRNYLDFGAGVGSGGILFARNGMEVTLADISSSLLRFTESRFERRRLPVRLVNLGQCELPREAFDLVTAMDVFEHLVDPVGTVDKLWETLRPGGFLFGRFNAEPDDHRAQHIVHHFGPVFRRMEAVGFVQIWEDQWLWGHQVFQKT
jgi:2-polyprenyl-3-methyl-5-hydroxy-6-metoxy-1,4-benzoquinol methylase